VKAHAASSPRQRRSLDAGKRFDVLIAGAGFFARAICMALATSVEPLLRVAVVARDSIHGKELCFLAASTARAAGSCTSFEPIQVEFESDRSLENVMAWCRPKLVVSCVSHHSPWEAQQQPSAWTELIKTASFGVTLPLQWPFVARIARALIRGAPDALFINGCFPDAVNVALRAAGLPIFCGLGNISTLAAALHCALELGSEDRLQLLAHHRHLSSGLDRADEMLVWSRGIRVKSSAGLLRRVRAIPRKEMCVIAGAAAARLLRVMLDGGEFRTHVPGPLGLPGGYPVSIRARDVALDLPASLSTAQAVAWNERAAQQDGALVSSRGDVSFSDTAAEALEEAGYEFASGFGLSEMDQACELMLRCRERLRQQAAT
jgi:hypothetical protein